MSIQTSLINYFNFLKELIVRDDETTHIIKEGKGVIARLEDESEIVSATDVQKVCSAVERLFRNGQIPESDILLKTIKHLQDTRFLQSDMRQHIKGLLCIAKTELKTMKIEEALTTMKSIEDFAPQLFVLMEEIDTYHILANLLICVHPSKIIGLIDKVEACIQKYESLEGALYPIGEMTYTGDSLASGRAEAWRMTNARLREKCFEILRSS